jgi:hypothetical protein
MDTDFFEAEPRGIQPTEIKEYLKTLKRRVSLDGETLEVLAQHRRQQEAERTLCGHTWLDLGLVFCKQEGSYGTPSNLEGIWFRLLNSAGVPKIRVN